jgi:hypothetical protein
MCVYMYGVCVGVEKCERRVFIVFFFCILSISPKDDRLWFRKGEVS